MQQVELGRSGIAVSSVIMGTWQAGKEMWVGIEDAQSEAAVRAAFEAGITTFDTAEFYGKGHAERILGKALAAVRGQVVLASKVFANHLKYDQVIQACNRSLKNMATDVIDLYQIHWPAGSFGSPRVPVAETMGALKDLQTAGKIRAIGVSNFSAAQIQEASQYGRIDSLQPPYSLFWRHLETDALDYCQANAITILAYSPMAQGLLTGKFGPDHKFAKGDHRAKSKLFKPQTYPKVQAALAALRPIAARNGVSLAQLALAWVLSHPNTCAIAGARGAGQIRESAAAAEVVLPAEDLAEMDRISRTVTAGLVPDPLLWDF
jgi:aryl-alcohol dehydrogenase-like predicted oxidoreductase